MQSSPEPLERAPIVTLMRSAGPPFRIRAQLASEIRGRHADGGESVLSLWRRSGGLWGVSVQHWDGKRHHVDSRLVKSPEEALDFAGSQPVGEIGIATATNDPASRLFARIRAAQTAQTLQQLCDAARIRWTSDEPDRPVMEAAAINRNSGRHDEPSKRT